MSVKIRLENADKNKFNFYYPNIHPKTGEVTEGIIKNKTLKEIRDFASRRCLKQDALDVIQQSANARSKERRAKTKSLAAQKMAEWEKCQWFRKGDALLGLGKKWFKKGFDTLGTPHRTYLNMQLTEQIFNEAGLKYSGFAIFYDHKTESWTAKKLGARNTKKLNNFLKK